MDVSTWLSQVEAGSREVKHQPEVLQLVVAERGFGLTSEPGPFCSSILPLENQITLFQSLGSVRDVAWMLS